MLTVTKINNSRKKEKAYKIYDKKGLFILVTATGSKLWRLKYSFLGKEKLLAIGRFPDLSLADARIKRDQARKQVKQNIDPGQKAEKSETFEQVAREWFDKFSPRLAASTRRTNMGRLERDLFPYLGSRPLNEIKAPELLAVLRRSESKGTVETAHRLKSICSQVFRYGVSTGKCENDPSTSLRGALAPTKVRHYAALTTPAEVGSLLRAIDGYEGSHVVRCALKLAPLVAARPGELRAMQWDEVNLETAEWNIPAEKMKMRQPHLVPLSVQAVKILRELQPLTGTSKFVFPSIRSTARPMSNNTLNSALRTLGYSKEKMVGHGWRACFRTIADEILNQRIEIVEMQLSHRVRDVHGTSYNRTKFLPERKQMMQLWSDYLDSLKTDTGAKIIAFPKKAS